MSNSHPVLAEGDVLVPGSAELAPQLLAAAEKAGLEPAVVRKSPIQGGYVVPAAVADLLAAAEKAAAKSAK